MDSLHISLRSNRLLAEPKCQHSTNKQIRGNAGNVFHLLIPSTIKKFSYIHQ